MKAIFKHIQHEMSLKKFKISSPFVRQQGQTVFDAANSSKPHKSDTQKKPDRQHIAKN